MDDYLDLVSAGDSRTSSCWGFNEHEQPNVSLPLHGSIRLCEENRGNCSLSMMSSNQNVESLPQDSSSLFLGLDTDYSIDKDFISGETDEQNEVQIGSVDRFVNGMMNVNLKAGHMALQDNSVLAIDSSNVDYQNQTPVFGDFISSSPSFTVGGVVGYDEIEQSDYDSEFMNNKIQSTLQQSWPAPSYPDVSSLCPLTIQDKMQQLDLQGGTMGDDIDDMRKIYKSMDKILLLNKFPQSITSESKEDKKYPPSSFAPVPNITVTANGSSPLQQWQNASTNPSGCCNGTAKPRVRARRGQATDPHSIAERLRREKIAERMRDLQELVPHSVKLDKASMLDEIIEYVKFLQLQVKVLSMSRLGAAGAVIPLIKDSLAEGGSNNYSLSASAGIGIETSPSPDQVALEQEVLKLMESNVTLAMQHLQSKGLCLMPIALATAISNGKTSLCHISSEERKCFDFIDGLTHNNGGRSSSSSSSSCCSLPGIEAHAVSRDGNIVTGKLSTNGAMVNDVNGFKQGD
ncbi:hypothetical protein K2173_016124 [Erythroxylum novogranatense]|uniref:BHLH domain-containing protein n=1 Tax=Erythroxylum novogranatense TaxID=1862640 RepID=A0AAV8SFJ5_9ROSI|nr:hypothetical protein K2173_016124 [Erythroxylum novogranatense]